MGCSDGEYFDDMNVKGENVGQVRLNFEANGDGVAFRFIDRTKEKKTGTLTKGGERDSSLSSGLKVNFDIPAD